MPNGYITRRDGRKGQSDALRSGRKCTTIGTRKRKLPTIFANSMPKGSNTISKHELKQRVTTRSIRPGDLEHQATLTRTKTRESTTPYTEDRLEVEAELAAERTKSIAIAPTKTSDGTILVDWYTTDDPANPQNWSNKNLNWKAVYYSSLLASEPIGHDHVPIQVHTSLLWPYST